MARKIHLGNRTDARAYGSWRAMKQRCNNKNHMYYSNYGGKGIKICPSWLDFDVFFSDMGERPEGGTLERIDAGGNYTPGNCVWATRTEQNRNRSNTTILNFRNQDRPLTEWSEITRIPASTIEYRLKSGWEVDAALTAPVQCKSPKHIIEYKGQSKTAVEWSVELGFGERIVYNRIHKLGWSVEKALTTPVKGKGGYRG